MVRLRSALELSSSDAVPLRLRFDSTRTLLISGAFDLPSASMSALVMLGMCDARGAKDYIRPEVSGLNGSFYSKRKVDLSSHPS